MNKKVFFELLWEKIKDIFPTNAEKNIVMEPTGDATIYINWKLNNNASRPNKRSKTIKIILTQEMYDDYIGMTDSGQQQFENDFRTAFLDNYKYVKPEENNVPPYKSAPIVEWDAFIGYFSR